MYYMGIYTDGNVYGVKWEIIDVNNEIVSIFEKTHTQKLNMEQIQEIKTFYDRPILEGCRRGCIHFYTKCDSTYECGLSNMSTSCMMWVSGTKVLLEELFVCGDICI